MKLSKSGTSLIEAIIAMFIIIIGVIGVYNIYINSTKLSTSTENRIKAISIAREGIEVLQNIRDTNWILFGADTKNCWNTYNYEPTCLGNVGTTNKIGTGNYIIYKDTNNRWNLQTGSLVGDFNNLSYRNEYKVNIDSDGLYTQSGGTTMSGFLFTRHINISYPYGPNNDARDEKMLIKSTVSWKDNSREDFYSVTLENLLTNWKRN